MHYGIICPKRNHDLCDEHSLFGHRNVHRSAADRLLLRGLHVPGPACRLPNKEFQVMELLAANPSQVISTDRNVKIKAARGQGYYLEIQS